ANMLHTLRQLLEDDSLWKEILRGLNEKFYHQTVTTEQIENYLSEKTQKDLSAFFNQYLRTTQIPVLEFKIKDDSINYRYNDVVDNFDMPVRVFVGLKEYWLFPNNKWKTEKLKGISKDGLLLDRNFYIESIKVMD
ncbi:MAG: M1 family peptidase, partial [Eudoraea sp.]